MSRDTRTYIKLHDGMPEHGKIDGLSDKAFRTLVDLWCWCARGLTDGVVPAATWQKRATAKVRAELTTAGLVEDIGGGVYMHDYLDHQRSADEVVALQKKRAEAGALGGSKTAANAKASAAANEQQASSKSAADTEELLRNSQTKAKPTTGADGAKRPPDPIWDALVEACGIRPTEITATSRGPLNKAVADLRSVTATAGQIQVRARRWSKMFPDAKLTPMALAKHWPQLDPATEMGKGDGWKKYDGE